MCERCRGFPEAPAEQGASGVGSGSQALLPIGITGRSLKNTDAWLPLPDLVIKLIQATTWALGFFTFALSQIARKQSGTGVV